MTTLQWIRNSRVPRKIKHSICTIVIPPLSLGTSTAVRSLQVINTTERMLKTLFLITSITTRNPRLTIGGTKVSINTIRTRMVALLPAVVIAMTWTWKWTTTLRTPYPYVTCRLTGAHTRMASHPTTHRTKRVKRVTILR